MQWFSEERGESSKHPGYARRRTAGIMITGSMVIVAPNRYSFFGLVMDCMEYVMAKGHDGLTIG
jgi:hypothetical protein